jgi:hypothetical protein
MVFKSQTAMLMESDVIALKESLNADNEQEA